MLGMTDLEEKITIDGKEYDTEKLSQAALDQLKNLLFVDARLNTLNNELAIADTARIAYTAALKKSAA